MIIEPSYKTALCSSLVSGGYPFFYSTHYPSYSYTIDDIPLVALKVEGIEVLVFVSIALTSTKEVHFVLKDH